MKADEFKQGMAKAKTYADAEGLIDQLPPRVAKQLHESMSVVDEYLELTMRDKALLAYMKQRGEVVAIERHGHIWHMPEIREQVEKTLDMWSSMLEHSHEDREQAEETGDYSRGRKEMVDREIGEIENECRLCTIWHDMPDCESGCCITYEDTQKNHYCIGCPIREWAGDYCVEAGYGRWARGTADYDEEREFEKLMVAACKDWLENHPKTSSETTQE